MRQPSDSDFASVTRLRRPYSTSGRPQIIDLIDDEWIKDKLPDDDTNTARSESLVAPLVDDGESDADAVVLSPAANSSAAANSASERRRREEGWNDLGLDQLDNGVPPRQVEVENVDDNQNNSQE